MKTLQTGPSSSARALAALSLILSLHSGWSFVFHRASSSLDAIFTTTAPPIPTGYNNNHNNLVPLFFQRGKVQFSRKNTNKSFLLATSTESGTANETFVASSSEVDPPRKFQRNNAFDSGRRKGKYSARRSGKNFQATGYKDIYGLNEALNRLAEEAGDSRNSVIRKAMAAEELWKEFNVPEDGTRKYRPDTVSFNIVLKAWSKATQVLADHHDDPKHDHLLDANIPIYTARECALHALELLNQQEKEFQSAKSKAKGDTEDDEEEGASGVAAPDVHSFNTLLDTWAKSDTDAEAIRQVEDLLGRMQKSPSLEPDVISYTALVEVYGVSNRSDRLEKLRRIWKYMDETPSLHPGTRATCSILHAYSGLIRENPNDALELAEEAQVKFDTLIQRFAESGHAKEEPDVVVYTNAMDVWSKVGTVDAAYKAEAIFRDLKATESTNVDLRPSSYTYSTLITAWSRVAYKDEAAERVDEILGEMIDDKGLLVLSNHPFTAALKCWARGRVKGKAIRALKTLKQMKELSKYDRRAYPSIQTYHAALDCCSRPSSESDLNEDTASLKIAFAIFQSLQKDGMKATNVTFSKLLRCVEALLPGGSERSKVALATFEKALAAGMADSTVLRAFQRAADVNVLQKAVGELTDHNGYIDYNRIPQAWRKNVKT